MSETFAAGGYTLRLIHAPPVYAPGGPVCFLDHLTGESPREALQTVEAEVAQRGGVLLIVQCTTEKPQDEALLRECGYDYASSWYVGPTDTTADNSVIAGPPDGVLRTAKASDVPRILEIGEIKRRQYEGFSPVFWKVAPTPRETFAPYVASQVEAETNVALVYEDSRGIRGYVIAQCRNLDDGYVDDFAIADAEYDWPTVGRSLLAEAAIQAYRRGVTAFTIVAGYADKPKRAAIRSLGFTLRKNWLVKPLKP